MHSSIHIFPTSYLRLCSCLPLRHWCIVVKNTDPGAIQLQPATGSGIKPMPTYWIIVSACLTAQCLVHSLLAKRVVNLIIKKKKAP